MTRTTTTPSGHLNHSNPSDYLCHDYLKGDSSDSIFTEPGLRSYGGLPSYTLFNLLLVFVVLIAFFFIWYYLESLLRKKGAKFHAWEKRKRRFGLVYPFKADKAKAALSGRDRNQVPTFGASWLWLDSADMVRQYGPDGFAFLSMQRYVMAYVAAVTLLVFVVILPVNVNHGRIHDLGSYEAGTMANVDPESYVLFVHVLSAFFLTPMAMCVMQRYVRKSLLPHFSYSPSQEVLMLSGLPLHMRGHQEISRWLWKKHRVRPSAIYLTFDTRVLHQVSEELRYYHWIEKNCGRKEVFHSWRCCGCCTVCEEAWLGRYLARDVYHYKLKGLDKAYIQHRRFFLRLPLHIAFVVVRDREGADHACTHGNMGLVRDETIRLAKAPPVDDIIWENFTQRRSIRGRKLCMLVLAIVVALFFTTPAAIMDVSEKLYALVSGHVQKQMPISDEWYMFMVFMVGRAIQMLAARAILMVGFSRQSTVNHVMLRVSTFYLTMILLFFPVLGKVSFIAIMSTGFTFESYDDWKESMRCMFVPQGGLNYVRFVISAATLGNAMELLRIPDFLRLTFRVLTAGSWMEVTSWLENEDILYWYGHYYAYDLLVLFITISFCVTTPTISLFGFCNFLGKHVVSTYILKMWAPTRVNIEFYRSTVSFTVGTSLAAQIFTSIIVCLRIPGGNIVAFTAGFGTVVSGLLFLCEHDSKWRWPFPVFPQELKQVDDVADKETDTPSPTNYFPPYARFLFKGRKEEGNNKYGSTFEEM